LKGQAAFAIEQMNDNKAGAKIIDRIFGLHFWR